MEQKRKGRPPKENSKTDKILIACSLVDKVKIKNEAEKNNLSVSSFVMNCIKHFI